MDGQTDVLSFIFAGKDNDSSAPTSAGCLMADVELLYLLYNNVSVLRCACLLCHAGEIERPWTDVRRREFAISAHLSPEIVRQKRGAGGAFFRDIHAPIISENGTISKKFWRQIENEYAPSWRVFWGVFLSFFGTANRAEESGCPKKNYLCKRQNSVEGFVMLATTRKNAKTFFSKAH